MTTPNPLSRRGFLVGTAAASALSIPATQSSGTETASATRTAEALAAAQPKAGATFISTWRFGKPANELAFETRSNGGDMLDAIEKGIGLVEADAKNASVGIGGIPNAKGVVQLDACIMAGPDHQAGSVAAIEDVLHPISVARRVMEDTIHVMLVGEGAKTFALESGFEATELLTEKQKENYQRYLQEQKKPPIDEDHHDTIAMLGVDENGDVFGGCSTSGWGFKIPGRVGDSPILGSGLYVDNEVGAAGATGIGENVMRYCASFMIVEAMRSGLSPQQACEATIERIVRKDKLTADDLAINFVAINRAGETGAAGTSKGFQFAVTTAEESFVRDAVALSNADIPEGGNRRSP